MKANKLRRPPRWISGLALWVVVLSAGAQSKSDLASASLDALLDLEVTGASKFALHVSDTPSSTTVIGADEIRALGYRTLGDALQSVRGLLVSSDRTYTYLGVRGYAAAGDYNTRILLLIDGNRVNDTVYDQAFLGSDFPLDMDLVERIEFIPGQGSAVHGGNALFGVVNVVTRRGAAVGTQELAFSVGRGNLRHLRVATNQPIGDTGLLFLSASSRRLAGTDAYYATFDTPQNGNGVSRRTDHERGEQLYLKYEQGEFIGTLIHGDREKGLSAYPTGLFGDVRNIYHDTQTMADATLAHRLDASNVWKLRAYAGSYSFRGETAADYPPVTINQDRGESRWWGAETHLLSEKFNGHKLVVGVDLQTSPRRDQSNADIAPASPPYLDDRHSSTHQAVFAEDQWTWSPALSVTAGVRWDRNVNEDASTQFSPRLALVGRPADELVLKFSYGTGFRAPNAYESYYAVPGTVGYKGNAALRNERVRGSELALEYRPNTSTRLTASAYLSRASDLLVQELDPADNQLVFRNLGSLRTHGLELEGERIWTGGERLRASYSQQHTRDTSGQGLGERSAVHLGKLAVILPLAEAWTLGNQTVLASRRGEVPGYGATNLTLNRRWAMQRTDLSFSVYDVLNRRPNDPGSDSLLQPVSPQDGRTWQLKLSLKF